MPVREQPYGFSLDLDALDPADAPGVGTPVLGGLRARELVAAVTGIAGRIDPIAIEIAELNPLRERDGKTTTLIAEILAAALGDCRTPRRSIVCDGNFLWRRRCP